ncbi:MAG: hypothetical protein RXO36_04085 [Candidatus Nanopusillus acidilobi]
MFKFKTHKYFNSLNSLFIQEAMKYFGFSISKVQTDNGSEFMGEFDKYLKEIGIEHYYSYPRTLRPMVMLKG